MLPSKEMFSCFNIFFVILDEKAIFLVNKGGSGD